MRHAVVVAPLGFTLPEGSAFAAPEPVGPLCAMLSRGGHRVVLVSTSAELETDFDRALAGMGPGDDLLVYVAAQTKPSAGGVALSLGAGNELGVHILSDAVLVREPSSVLFVVEAHHDGDAGDPMLATELVEEIVAALDARARGYGALVGVRALASERVGAWPFTHHLLAALEHPSSRDERGAAPMAAVYERVRTSASADSRVQSFSYVRSPTDIVLVLANAVAPVATPSQAPAAPSTVRSSSPSLGHVQHSPRPPQPSLPPLEPLLNLAEGARERGTWEEALAGYKAALMVAPVDDKAVRASIYAHASAR